MKKLRTPYKPSPLKPIQSDDEVDKTTKTITKVVLWFSVVLGLGVVVAFWWWVMHWLFKVW